MYMLYIVYDICRPTIYYILTFCTVFLNISFIIHKYIIFVFIKFIYSLYSFLIFFRNINYIFYIQ